MVEVAEQILTLGGVLQQNLLRVDHLELLPGKFEAALFTVFLRGHEAQQFVDPRGLEALVDPVGQDQVQFPHLLLGLLLGLFDYLLLFLG